MKIYISNYDPSKIKNDLPNLDKYYLDTDFKYELYSEEGIFMVDNKQSYKMKINLDKTEKFLNYIDNIDLWVDKSEYNYEIISQIPVDVSSIPVITFKYKLDKKSKLTLIVEGSYDVNTLHYVSKTNKYNSFNTKNFYFEADNKIDISNEDIKKEIIEFLSVLN